MEVDSFFLFSFVISGPGVGGDSTYLSGPVTILTHKSKFTKGFIE